MNRPLAAVAHHQEHRPDGVHSARARVSRAVAVPAALYAVALAVYGWAAGMIGFAVNEGSAYYVAVAGNVATGRGLVIDAIWSYSTPPLELPRPAFELWQPLASLLLAGPMAILGQSLGVAQLAMAAVAALLAPLAWLVAREACDALRMEPRRGTILALGAGTVTALMGPFIMPTALPDSTIPFAVAGTAACVLIARSVVAPSPLRARLWLVLGVVVGVAWLARHEAVWLALAALLTAAAFRALDRRMVAAAIGGGLLVAVPWLVRNMLVFGIPLPGQALDNALLTSNEQIFAYLEHPSGEAFLGQGLAGLVGNVSAAAAHNFVGVLLVPAAPVAVTGLLALAYMLWRRRALRVTSLGVLALAGALTFAATTLLFPVASLWGTFEHAAGPIHLALVVAAVLGLDRAVQVVGRWRGWQRSNAWLAPLALGLLLLPLTALQVSGLSQQAEDRAAHWQELARSVLAQPEAIGGRRPVVVSDRPIWLSEATGLPAVALPAEPLSSLEALAAEFGASLVVISEQRGGYPALMRSPAARACFTERPPLQGQPAGTAIFVIAPRCR